MKKIIQFTCILLALGFVFPLSAKNNKQSKTTLPNKFGTVDFIAYNSTSSTAWVYLYNTATNQGTYYSVPANTPPTGTVIGQIEENNDIYNGTVQMDDSSNRTIQLYYAYDTNVSTLYGTGMAIGCASCAYVRIN